MSTLSLEIITPKGTVCKTNCTSVQFNICDDLKGKQGGSYGVRTGHAKAIFALEKGLVKVFCENSLILNYECGEGFANVDKNLVSLVVESFNEL